MTEMRREICADLSAELAQLRRYSQEVAGFLEAHALSPRVTYAVDLVLEELITNIIKYAYDDDKTHEIRVRVALEAEYVVVQIEDDGRPFNPLEAPAADVHKPLEDRPIGGLGLHLVRQMTEHMDYRRIGNKNHVEVRVALAGD